MHGLAACTLLGSRRIDQGLVDDRQDIRRHKLAENMLGRGHELERGRDALRGVGLVLTRTVGHSDHLGVERQQTLDAKLLIHAVLGVVVDKLDTVKLTGTIRIADMRGDHAGLIEIGLRGVALKVHDNVCAVTEIRGRLTPARDNLAFDAVVRPRSGELFGRALHRRIETAGKAAVRGNNDNQAMLDALMLLQHGIGARTGGVAGDRQHDVGQRLLIGLGLLGAIEGTTNLGRRDHLHRARDLLGRGNRGDSLLNVAKVGHGA